MLKSQSSKRGAFLAAISLAVSLVAIEAVPATAGPFSWLTGKNQQQQQQQEQQLQQQPFPQQQQPKQ